jgi:hypothetical protein
MIPFINEHLLKQHSPITSGVETDAFIPYLAIAQELYIAPILGESLTCDLSEQIAANTLTSTNSNLIAKLAPALAFYTVYQGLPFHWASIVNKGVTIRDSENSKGLDLNSLSQLRRWLKDDAERFADLLAEFLDKHQGDYPLWKPSAGSRHCRPRVTAYDSGFYFPKR